MGVPDHLTCLLRNLYAGQEATVRTRHGKTDWLQFGKGIQQGFILTPCLFNLYAEYIVRSSGLDEAQARIKTAGRKVNKLRYEDGNPYDSKQRVTKGPPDEGERGEWKSWLQTQQSKRRIMASSQGNSEKLFWGALKSLQMVTTAMKLKDACSLEENLWQT